MKKYEDYKKSKEEKYKKLENFPSFANRKTYGLLDEVKHNLVVAMANLIGEKLRFLNESDLNKVMACRSDFITLEYVLEILEKITPGSKETIKNKIFNKLNEVNRNIFLSEDVSIDTVAFLVTADVMVQQCEKQGIKNIDDVFFIAEFPSLKWTENT